MGDADESHAPVLYVFAMEIGYSVFRDNVMDIPSWRYNSCPGGKLSHYPGYCPVFCGRGQGYNARTSYGIVGAADKVRLAADT